MNLKRFFYGLGFKLILKRNNNDRALFRTNAGADAVGNDGNTDITDISWCLPSIDRSNDKRIIVQKVLSKKNNVDFIMKERRFIRMYPMLLTSCLIWVWKVVWKDHKI